MDKLEVLVEDMEKKKESMAKVETDEDFGLLYVQFNKTDTNICLYANEDTMQAVDCQNELISGLTWSLKVPSEAFNMSWQQNTQCIYLGVLQFKEMGNLTETSNYTILNNRTYGIKMNGNITNLSNKIEMVFTHNEPDSNASCSSWDGKGKREWTTYGCETERVDNFTIKCSCSHLTFFAVLMSPFPDEKTIAPHLESLTYISYIGCGISVFFLGITLFMHFLLRKAKSNQTTKILMNLLVALFLLNLTFLSNESMASSGNKGACVFIALVMHYSMLSTFSWFFIQGLHMYLWLIRQNCAQFRRCWIDNIYIHYILNTGYYILIFIFTAGIFITILTRVVQLGLIQVSEGRRKTFQKQMMLLLSLFLLFGLTWSVAFFSYGEMLIPSYYIFTVVNSFQGEKHSDVLMQGFFLFLYYYNIHRDTGGHFSDPKTFSSTVTMVPPQPNSEEHVYDNVK
ncbi:hypothetical protein DNTS_016261 [Danionella cerebrum]|uniref:GPS domain-containing protein n=1 Tax=Danionella cerebrum TaxID=2873325 RepID=A0A553Q0T1_9TELE|nr:hypothetical protein DNTS_016261 [Danionella translucida]